MLFLGSFSVPLRVTRPEFQWRHVIGLRCGDPFVGRGHYMPFDDHENFRGFVAQAISIVMQWYFCDAKG